MPSQLINMEDYEFKGNIPYKDLDSKRALIDKMLADKINEILLRLDEVEEKI